MLPLKVFAIMNASRNNALKLSVVAFVIGLYFVMSFADAKVTADATIGSADKGIAKANGNDDSKKASATPDNSTTQTQKPLPLFNMSQQEADRRSAGCVDCHKG